MNGRIDCPRQDDVIDAVMSRRWPERADVELRAHVDTCAICSDLAMVSDAFTREQHAAWDEAAHLPSSEVIWWRAQMRARADAARIAARPLTVVHAIGAAAFVGVAAAFGSTAAAWLGSGMARLADSAAGVASRLPSVSGLDMSAILAEPESILVRGTLVAAGVCLLIVPVAIYLVTAEDR